MMALFRAAQKRSGDRRVVPQRERRLDTHQRLLLLNCDRSSHHIGCAGSTQNTRRYRDCGWSLSRTQELVGDFKNAGRQWHPQGRPPAVRVHDFQDDELGKATPYGVYDLGANAGWASVGTDHDTPEFAVESIYCWWRQIPDDFHGDWNYAIAPSGPGQGKKQAHKLRAKLQKQFADDA